MKITNIIKNKYTTLAIVAIAVLGIGLFVSRGAAKSDNCTQLAPTHPQFDVWPLSYNPTATCVDLAQIDAANLSATGRDGRFAQSQSEHDAGINANSGDTVDVSVYFHNGASDQASRSQTTAHNTTISVNTSTAATTAHDFASSISASNAATVTSASRGGDIVVHTVTPTTVSYVPGSAFLCISTQYVQVLGKDPNSLQSCGSGGTDRVVPVPDGIFNGSASLNDLEACFPFSGTLDFHVQINGQAQQNGALTITKQVMDLTSGQNTFATATNAKQGDTVEYQITVTDSGSGPVNSVVVNDTGVTGITASSGIPNNTNIGTLSAGQNRIFNYTGTVTAATGTLINTATASGTGVAQVSSQATVTATPAATGSLSITKGVNDLTRGTFGFAPSVNALNGDTVQFQIVVTDNSSINVNNVTVSDNMPGGLNFQNGSMTISNGSASVNNLNNIPIGNLTPNQNVIITFNATVTQTGSFTDTATASAPGVNSVTAQATVNAQGNQTCSGNLTVSKLVRNNTQGSGSYTKSVSANPGDNISYQITIGAQNCTATNVSVFDTLPQFFNYSFGSARLNNNNLSDSFINSTLNIGSIAQGNTDVITFSGNVSNSVSNNSQTVLTNTVNVSADNTGTVSDSATVIVTSNNAAFSQLSISKLVRDISFQNTLSTNISAFQNDRVGFQITVMNVGGTTLNNVTLNDPLPSGFAYATGTTTLDNNVAPDITQGNIFLGQMSPGQQHIITFQGNVNGSINSTIQNTAFATATNAAQVQSTASVIINSSVAGANVNLVLSKRAFNNTKNADATSVAASKEDFITYTLTVVNNGNSPATNYVISDDLSNVLNLASLTDNGGGTLNGNVLSWAPVTVPANGSISETFKVRINFFLPSNVNLNLINTFGNTVTISIGQVLGATFIAPTTGSDLNIALGFGAAVTVLFAIAKRKGLFSRLFAVFGIK